MDKLHFNAINIKGKRFGRLIALYPTKKRNGSNIVWKFKCDCGNYCFVNTVNIKNSTKSCGCLKKELRAKQIGKNGINYKYGIEESRRRSKIKANYNITLEKYNEMLKAQNGVCAICGEKESKRFKHNNKLYNLSIDHDHKTGKIRGLLCQNCNSGIGMFKDSIKLLKQTIKYLKG